MSTHEILQKQEALTRLAMKEQAGNATAEGIQKLMDSGKTSSEILDSMRQGLVDVPIDNEAIRVSARNNMYNINKDGKIERNQTAIDDTEKDAQLANDLKEKGFANLAPDQQEKIQRQALQVLRNSPGWNEIVRSKGLDPNNPTHESQILALTNQFLEDPSMRSVVGQVLREKIDPAKVLNTEEVRRLQKDLLAAEDAIADHNIEEQIYQDKLARLETKRDAYDVESKGVGKEKKSLEERISKLSESDATAGIESLISAENRKITQADSRIEELKREQRRNAEKEISLDAEISKFDRQIKAKEQEKKKKIAVAQKNKSTADTSVEDSVLETLNDSKDEKVRDKKTLGIKKSEIPEEIATKEREKRVAESELKQLKEELQEKQKRFNELKKEQDDFDEQAQTLKSTEGRTLEQKKNTLVRNKKVIEEELEDAREVVKAQVEKYQKEIKGIPYEAARRLMDKRLEKSHTAFVSYVEKEAKKEEKKGNQLEADILQGIPQMWYEVRDKDDRKVLQVATGLARKAGTPGSWVADRLESKYGKKRKEYTIQFEETTFKQELDSLISGKDQAGIEESTEDFVKRQLVQALQKKNPLLTPTVARVQIEQKAAQDDEFYSRLKPMIVRQMLDVAIREEEKIGAISEAEKLIIAQKHGSEIIVQGAQAGQLSRNQIEQAAGRDILESLDEAKNDPEKTKEVIEDLKKKNPSVLAVLLWAIISGSFEIGKEARKQLTGTM